MDSPGRDAVWDCSDEKCPKCGHLVRKKPDGSLVPHDVEGLEPVGEDYWSGDKDGIGHLRCRE